MCKEETCGYTLKCFQSHICRSEVRGHLWKLQKLSKNVFLRAKVFQNDQIWSFISGLSAVWPTKTCSFSYYCWISYSCLFACVCALNFLKWLNLNIPLWMWPLVSVQWFGNVSEQINCVWHTTTTTTPPLRQIPGNKSIPTDIFLQNNNKTRWRECGRSDCTFVSPSVF